MRRWARRARESYARCYTSDSSDDAVQDAFRRVVVDAESLLSTLDDDVQFSDGTCASGSMARIALSRAAVDALRSELQDEVQKRLEAVRKSAFALPNGYIEGITPVIENPANTLSQEGKDQLLLTPNGNARPGAPPVGSPQSHDADSPVSVVGAPEETIDDPFVVPAPAEHAIVNGNAGPEHKAPAIESPQPQDADSPVSVVGAPEETIDDPFVVATPVAEITERAIVQEIPSPSTQESASTSATLLVVEEELKGVQPHSPAVSMLDLQEDVQPSCTDDPLTTDLPLVSNAQILVEDTGIPPTSISHTPLDPPSPIDVLPALLSELETTKHRYDALQRAFRDCSLALKELKRTLVSASPSSPAQTRLRQHLETALARIDDYAEDARVELEIRIADEELTLRGFEMVLSVRGALIDADERAEVEASARAFVDGTDDGVAKAADKFGKKLEDVEHDVAVVKRAVHGLAMSEGEDEARREESVDETQGWTAWTAGLLGASTTPRSPTPVQTFGTVMTSPRLRHAGSLQQLRDESGPGPLAGLDLRIPMPSPAPAQAAWTHLGLGRVEGEKPRTLSAMYAVGGLRSASSLGLGVGLGGSSPSPARSRGMSGLGMGMGSSPLRAKHDRDKATDTREVHDLGGVE